MFLNQIKIRNEHFTRHCLHLFAVFSCPQSQIPSPRKPPNK